MTVILEGEKAKKRPTFSRIFIYEVIFLMIVCNMQDCWQNWSWKIDQHL